jgi:hypothetical protein
MTVATELLSAIAAPSNWIFGTKLDVSNSEKPINSTIPV